MNQPNTLKTNAIVLGSTGLVGSNIIDLLIDEPSCEAIYALSRREVVYKSPKVKCVVVDFEKILSDTNCGYLIARLHENGFRDLSLGGAPSETQVNTSDTSNLLNIVLYSALGTTVKIAGSIEAQRKVDVDSQYLVAKSLYQAGVRRMQLVSSSMANPKARSPYLKMKGELEEALIGLGWSQLTIVRPSLLLGDRDHFRLGEKLGEFLMPLITWIPGLRKYRAIRGREVAARLVHEVKNWGVKHDSDLKSNLQVFELDQVFLFD